VDEGGCREFLVAHGRFDADGVFGPVAGLVGFLEGMCKVDEADFADASLPAGSGLLEAGLVDVEDEALHEGDAGSGAGTRQPRITKPPRMVVNSWTWDFNGRRGVLYKIEKKVYTKKEAC